MVNIRLYNTLKGWMGYPKSWSPFIVNLTATQCWNTISEHSYYVNLAEWPDSFHSLQNLAGTFCLRWGKWQPWPMLWLLTCKIRHGFLKEEERVTQSSLCTVSRICLLYYSCDHAIVSCIWGKVQPKWCTIRGSCHCRLWQASSRRTCVSYVWARMYINIYPGDIDNNISLYTDILHTDVLLILSTFGLGYQQLSMFRFGCQ